MSENSDGNDTTEMVIERLMRGHDTADAVAFENDHIGYWANSERTVPPSALRYVQNQGFEITMTGTDYRQNDGHATFPERLDRELAWFEARR